MEPVVPGAPRAVVGLVRVCWGGECGFRPVCGGGGGPLRADGPWRGGSSGVWVHLTVRRQYF